MFEALNYILDFITLTEAWIGSSNTTDFIILTEAWIGSSNTTDFILFYTQKHGLAVLIQMILLY